MKNLVQEIEATIPSSSEGIYFSMVRNRVLFPDLAKAMEMTFEITMTYVDRIFSEKHPKNQAEFATRINAVCVNWAKAALQMNKTLYREGSKEFVDLNGFQVSLRAKVPNFYWKLLMVGLTPLPDEKAQVEKIRGQLDAFKKHAPADSRKRHKGKSQEKKS
jgi:hypothetical protein